MMNDALYTTKRELNEHQNQLSIQMNKWIKQYQLLLIDYSHQIDTNMSTITKESRNKLSKNIALLDAYSPLKILQRGYAITSKKDKTIRSIKEIHTKDTIQIKYIDGSAEAEIKNTKEN